jgi:mannose-1-phosphate guanylyltransferase/mannose-6-phosphate isomerase
MLVPVILAGGTGTRLWPLSRDLYPKQLLNLVGADTLLQSTVLRFAGLENVSAPVVICNDHQRFMVAEQLRAIDIDTASIILEPVGRNTAPAVAVAALTAMAQDPDAVLLILPADHHIQHPLSFQRTVKIGQRYAEQGYLITFGIVPHAPETGYGYIRKGAPVSAASGIKKPQKPAVAYAIDEFVEKPDLETARNYLNSGDYFWNSGMFMFRAARVLEELNTFVPKMVLACQAAIASGRKDLDFFRLGKEAFAACPADSIDYAVMERTDAGAMVPFDAGWSDLGSWEALWQAGEKDAGGNVLKGDVLVHDVKNSYLHATGRLIAAVGLSDHIVVETADAVVISPMDRVQEIKGIVDRLKQAGRVESFSHRKVYRPWGSQESIDAAERFQVKRITLRPGARISSQKHFNRAEHWVVVRGTALVTRGEDQFILKEDESAYIPIGIVHRIENPGKIPLELIEVRTGSYIEEDDIVRFQDDYGR